jgi:hypothetical protein
VAAVVALAAAIAAAGSCTSIILPQVAMGTAPASPACQDVISRVFAQSGFVPVSMPEAPPMLFAPRTMAPLTFTPTFGWMIGVSFSAPCAFHLQALSTEPECVALACAERSMTMVPPDRTCFGIFPTCPLSPTGGSDFAGAIVELTRRIKMALATSGADRAPGPRP